MKALISKGENTIPKDIIKSFNKIVNKLELCTVMDELDIVFDDAKLAVGDICLRNNLLMKHMGVLDVYGSYPDGVDFNELQYEMTKEVFIDGDWKYMK